MDKKNIIVIGASAGGFQAIKQLIASLPADLDAAMFIVWHMAAEVKGILPHVLNRLQTIRVEHAVDKEPISFNRIYIAPPDRHLIVENGFVRITRGPKENRFRPAVDPLFRSAANSYGSRVIGIVLSGALDDGTAGLWTIKNYGGTAIVQDPNDAEVPSMPENALAAVNVDYCVPISEMGSLLVRLSGETATEMKKV
ncbi:MAG TPA: chemotaxis protein CheB, partial [Flavisolibacter sp.]|nr:chemotaxis protein CheB [Flavisolibacter sp.]